MFWRRDISSKSFVGALRYDSRRRAPAAVWVLSITESKLPSRAPDELLKISRLRWVDGSISTHFFPENFLSARILRGLPRRFSVA